MDLDDEGLSASERELAAQLSQLAADPGTAPRDAIMARVRGWQPSPRRRIGRWRHALAAAAAAAILVASAVGAFAASGDAMPSSPAYSVRDLGEHARIVFAGPLDRELLRISFANSRIAQARTALNRGDRSSAGVLLHDSRVYLDQAKQDLAGVSTGEQAQIENELEVAETDEHAAESELDQAGGQES